jgi:hypothetical protein
MKMVKLLLPGLFALGGLVLPLTAFELVKDGKPAAVVYLKEGEGVPEQSAIVPRRTKKYTDGTPIQQTFNQALFDFRDFIGKISGAELEYQFVKSVDEIKGSAVILGSLAIEAGLEPPQGDDRGEAFAIKTAGDHLLIAGFSKYGTSYGIYELLRRLGVDWVLPGEIGEVYPCSPNISVPPLSIEQTPSFRMRAPWLHGSFKIATRQERIEFARWQVRHKQQIDYGLYGEEYAAGGHAWGVFKNSRYDKYFEKHPEIAALRIAGDSTSKRIRYQLDSTNPHTVDMIADYIRAKFADNHWPADKRVSLSIGPADGDGFDEGPESKRLQWRRDPITGENDMTDLLVKLANELLEKLLPEYPNLHLGFFSYHSYADFPGFFRPHRNLAIQVADITPSRFHGICDAGVSPSRAYYKQVLEKWSAAGAKIVFWHYNWNLAESVLPYSKLRILGEDMPYEHRLGVIGYGDEYTQNLSVTAPHDYLQARLMWDITLNWKDVSEEFCRKAYGKGWRPMVDYYMMLCDTQANSPDETGSFIPFGRLYSRADANQMSIWLQQAESLAETDREKRRIRIAAYPVEQLHRYLDFYEAYTDFRFESALDAADTMLAAYERENSSDYPQGVSRHSDSFMRSFLRNFAAAGIKYSTGGYHIVRRIPERMKFVYDGDQSGEQLALWSPLLRDDEFPDLSTYRSTLSRQGGIGFRRGAIWYRTRLELPKIVLKGKEEHSSVEKPADSNTLVLNNEEGIGLFLGGFDNEAKVWINGVFAGRLKGFLIPGVLDITDQVKKDGKPNSIVICVTRRGNAESATGGLIYPSFIFKGPRVPPDGKSEPDRFRPMIPGQPNQ